MQIISSEKLKVETTAEAIVQMFNKKCFIVFGFSISVFCIAV